MPSSEEVIPRAGSVRAMTGLTAPESTALLPSVEPALLAYMEDHTLDGQPRTTRRDRTYDPSPLPTRAGTWRFLLTSLPQQPIPAVQGQRFGMSQAHAHNWLHLRHTVLSQALAQQAWLPARPAGALATLLTRKPPQEGATSPLFGMMVLSAPSLARGRLKSRKPITAASRSATRSQPAS